MNISTQKFYTGATWAWTECPADYPSDQFSLKAILKHGTDPVISIDGTPEADLSFSFLKAAVETGQLNHGSYSYQFIAEHDGIIAVIAEGTMEIYPLLTSSKDTRSYWQRIYEEAQDKYEKLVNKEFDEVTIQGRTIRYSDREKLLTIMTDAKKRMDRENGLNSYPKIRKIRF